MTCGSRNKAVTSVYTFVQITSTPSLVVSAAIARRNIDRMAAYAVDHRVHVRPHTKTHKSVAFARAQINARANGLTVAKVGEAEVMVQAEDDVLIAYPVVDEHRCERVAALARDNTVRVAVDSVVAAEALARAARRADASVGILVDLDVGFHRTGVRSPDDALALARELHPLRELRLDGLFIYPGHVWSRPAVQAADLAPIAERVETTLDLWRRDGFETPIVSGGSTPTAYQSHLIPQLTEIR